MSTINQLAKKNSRNTRRKTYSRAPILKKKSINNATHKIVTKLQNSITLFFSRIQLCVQNHILPKISDLKINFFL